MSMHRHRLGVGAPTTSCSCQSLFFFQVRRHLHRLLVLRVRYPTLHRFRATTQAKPAFRRTLSSTSMARPQLPVIPGFDPASYAEGEPAMLQAYVDAAYYGRWWTPTPQEIYKSPVQFGTFALPWARAVLRADTGTLQTRAQILANQFPNISDRDREKNRHARDFIMAVIAHRDRESRGQHQHEYHNPGWAVACVASRVYLLVSRVADLATNEQETHRLDCPRLECSGATGSAPHCH